MKKTKMGIFKVYYFAIGSYSLAIKVYLEYLYFPIHNLVLSIFGLFQDFAPIPMYGENKKNVSSLHREYYRTP